jgi:signal transduction histidine kinase
MGARVSAIVATDGPSIALRDHSVQFYFQDQQLLDALGDYIGEALRDGNIGLVIATSEHRNALRERLTARGIAVDDEAAAGRYLAYDASETLSKFMVQDAPEIDRFNEVIGGAIRAAESTGRSVRAFGEMVALLAGAGNERAALSLEGMWNDLQRDHPFTLLCAYPMDILTAGRDVGLLEAVCSHHTEVMAFDEVARTPLNEGQLVVQLQQRALWLEAEVIARKHAEESLEGALAAEKVALRQRDEFLAVAAHELRTPLTTLIANVQLLQRYAARDAATRTPDLAPDDSPLTAVTGAAWSLVSLLDQLLDVSRINAGRLQPQREPTEVGALLRGVLDRSWEWSAEHEVTFEGPAALVADVDPLRVEQVVVNLLQNAVRYTPAGTSIAVLLEPGKQSQGGFQIAVRDYGPGVPLADRERIFERFFQSGAGYRQGLGLGLHISREIVEGHGGTLTAEYPDGGGSLFLARFP